MKSPTSSPITAVHPNGVTAVLPNAFATALATALATGLTLLALFPPSLARADSREPPTNPPADSASGVDGIYSVRQEISGKVYQDLLILRADPHQGGDPAGPAGPYLAGSLTVPGVFSAPLREARLGSPMDYTGMPRISFSILANEGGRTFTVHYYGRFRNGETGEDSLLIFGQADLDGGEHLGAFTARRIDHGTP